MVEQITLYTWKPSPFGHRAEIALAEAKANYQSFEINTRDKPEWFVPQVNPETGKVPAITYGGPVVSPEHPSPESAKVIESLIIVEFVADLFPESGLMPKDPVQRAKARFFIDAVTNQFASKFRGMFNGDPELEAGLIQGAQALEKLLAGKFALGDKFTAADVALVPFLLRGELIWSFHDPSGLQKQIQDKAPRLWQYLQDVKTHPSVASTWDHDAILPIFKGFLGGQK